MKYLHTMVRVTDVDASLRFYSGALGLKEVARQEVPQGRFTLIFLAAPGDESAQIEMTYNWDPQPYEAGRNFGHVAYGVEDIYATCQRLMDCGVTINRPPRDGRMAFVRSPTISPWSCCRTVRRWRQLSPGSRCPTAASGSPPVRRGRHWMPIQWFARLW